MKKEKLFMNCANIKRGARKAVGLLTVMTICCTIGSLNGGKLCDNNKRFRTEKCVVVETSDNLFTLETKDGNLWQTKASCDENKTSVIVVFDNNGTEDDLTDDSIISVK
jgi:hypothetical protein